MNKLTRRDFLHHAGQAGVALSASRLLTGCTLPLPAMPNTPGDAAARVVAIRGTDLAAMARQALDAFGGAASFISPGETVFIKPNFGAVGMVKYNPITQGDSVKPEIVLAVAEECLKAGASMVTIGEAGQVPSWDWSGVPTFDGMTTVGAEAARLRGVYGNRITLACLNAETPEWDRVPSQTPIGDIEVSSLATRADHVISLPVIKTHRWTLMTGALKNLFGLTSVTRYSTPTIDRMRAKLHNAGLHQIVAEIAGQVRPDFSIMDFSIGCEGNGPHVLPGWWGTTVDVRDRLGTWMLLASPDPVALDATSARVIGLDPADIQHLLRAYNSGLGQMLEEKIELTGAALDELRMDWQKPDLTEGFMDVIIPGIHLLTDGQMKAK